MSASETAAAARQDRAHRLVSAEPEPEPEPQPPQPPTPLTIASAVAAVAAELGLPAPHRPKAVAAAAIEQLGLDARGSGLKAQLAEICGQLDIATGWQDPAAAPLGAAARRFVLAIGGWGSDFRRLQRVDALECAPGGGGFRGAGWLPLPPLRVARCGAAACVSADGSVLAAGGMGEASAELLPATVSGGWQALPPMSAERCGARAVRLHGHRLAVFGGSQLSGRLLLNSAEAFDTRTNTWTALAPMKTPRVNFACGEVAAAGGNGAARVIVAGGEISAPSPGTGGQTGITESVEVYEVVSDSWSKLPSLSAQRFGGGGVSLGEGLTLVFGGFGGKSSDAAKTQAGGFTGLAPVPSRSQAAPPPPPPGQAGRAGGGGDESERANAELALFVSSDVTSLIQAQVPGAPQPPCRLPAPLLRFQTGSCCVV